MTAKKHKFNYNNSPKWSEINWIRLETSNSVDSLKKLISFQRLMFVAYQDDLLERVKVTEIGNNNLTEEELHQYIDHMHGMEERMSIELERIINVSEISTILAVFESKLKIICDKIILEFGGQLPEKSNSVIHKHWKFLKNFLGDQIGKTETSYTYLKNVYVLRNILVHQDSILTEAQYLKIKDLKNIEIIKYDNEMICVKKVEYNFVDNLVDNLEIFFVQSINSLHNRTNSIL